MMHIQVAARLSPGWSAAGDFVRARYSKAFAADVLPAPDAFVIAAEEDTDPAVFGAPAVLACAGLTYDSEHGFFSERYLGGPVELAVERATGASCDRASVVEVGSLAGGGDRTGLELIRLLPVVAWTQGMTHILCTATAQLSRTLSRVGIPFVPLAPADPIGLSDFERERWGSYYEQAPYTGVIPLDALGELFSAATGRYRFTTPGIAVADRARAKEVVGAHS